MEQLVYQLKYHFVESVTYRRKAFYNQQIVYSFEATIHYISKTFNVEAINVEWELDQINENTQLRNEIIVEKSMIYPLESDYDL